MLLVLIDEVKEDIVDGTPDEGAQVEKLAINPMKRRLQEVAFTRILRIEQFQKLLMRQVGRLRIMETNLQNEVLVNVLLCNVGVEIGRLNET